ncbi:MAG: terminase large subunit, partial [Acidobacteria bacterium]|nr:terminase large subunit [Acidobacteriota bacterium]
ETTWLDLDAWRECGAVISDAALQEREAFGGLDLSSTLDLTAFALAIPHEGRVYIRHWAWLPADGILERELRDRVPYRRWASEGRIELIPGGVVAKRVVIDRIKELAQVWRIRAIGFDRWGADMVQSELEKAGLEVIEMGQGFSSLSAPTKEFESFVVSRTLAHGACPLLAWQAACCSIKSDPAGNVKPAKPDRLKSTKRIDGIVAAIMATGVMMRLGVKRRLEDILANCIEL